MGGDGGGLRDGAFEEERDVGGGGDDGGGDGGGGSEEYFVDVDHGEDVAWCEL